MEGQVLLYDSLGQPKAALIPELEEQIVALYDTTAGQGGNKNNDANCTKKTDGRCFPIAWAVHLAYSDKPQTVTLQYSNVGDMSA